MTRSKQLPVGRAPSGNPLPWLLGLSSPFMGRPRRPTNQGTSVVPSVQITHTEMWNCVTHERTSLYIIPKSCVWNEVSPIFQNGLNYEGTHRGREKTSHILCFHHQLVQNVFWVNELHTFCTITPDFLSDNSFSYSYILWSGLLNSPTSLSVTMAH